MTMDSLVSVVIPTHNYGKYISDAIDSVIGQTYKKVEIIIVDDGSTDNTSKIVKKYENKVRYFQVDKAGVSNARNFGGQKAKGKYIVFLDADDILTKNYITKTLAVMNDQNNEVGYIYTQLQCFGVSDYTTQYPGFRHDYLKVSNFVAACSLMKADIVKKYRYDTSIEVWEDWDFYLTLAENGIKGVLLNEPLLLYRKHDDGKSALDTFTSKKKLYSTHKLRIKHWKQYGYVDTVRHWVWYIHARVRIHTRSVK